MLLIGAIRVIAQALHLPGGFSPPQAQGAAFFTVNHISATADVKDIPLNSAAQIVDTIHQTMICQHLFHCGSLLSAHLNHRPQFLVKQGSQRIITQGLNIHLHATMASKSHFSQCH
ncbi:Uncharacterised protein [Yersinia enterocolitica]|nr:Uncharacterised protein [Yersinia enterocolitica]